MQFHKAELVISAPDRNSWPDTTLPEIVLAGRSNVGKSSFINAMTGRKNLAYVGSTPGKTRLLNFFNLDDKYMLVDVPGYGYANISKQQLLRFGEMMEDYFNERKQKKGAVILVDSRHLPTEDDHTMLEFIRYFHLPIVIVATKIDKVPKSKTCAPVSRLSAKICSWSQMRHYLRFRQRPNREEKKSGKSFLNYLKNKRKRNCLLQTVPFF